MFTLDPNPTFDEVVEIPVPGADPENLELTFKHMRRKAYTELMGLVGKGEMSEIDALCSMVAGWKNVDVEYSREAMERLIDNYPGAALAIPRKYSSALIHGRAKN